MMRSLIRIITLVILLVGLSTTKVWTMDSIRIKLEANPSSTCFPASALQLPELKEDFARICRDCEFIPEYQPKSDFRIVVEDPGYSWVLKIYNRNNKMVKKWKWSGGLHTGLQKASGYIHSHTRSSPN
jgi:hypothetical protein